MTHSFWVKLFNIVASIWLPVQPLCCYSFFGQVLNNLIAEETVYAGLYPIPRTAVTPARSP